MKINETIEKIENKKRDDSKIHQNTSLIVETPHKHHASVNINEESMKSEEPMKTTNVRKNKSVFTKYLIKNNELIKKRTINKTLKINKQFIKSMLPKPGVLHRFYNDIDSDFTTHRLSTTTGRSPDTKESFRARNQKLKPTFVNLEKLRESFRLKKEKFEVGNKNLMKIYRV
mmetsp:Transcript_31813/g.28172  ORF Transcript_31813/g.28172 Transcript_31813/m.28172 type:complete len:172 (+) Transcript_31813:847-1362(+)